MLTNVSRAIFFAFVYLATCPAFAAGLQELVSAKNSDASRTVRMEMIGECTRTKNWQPCLQAAKVFEDRVRSEGYYYAGDSADNVKDLLRMGCEAGNRESCVRFYHDLDDGKTLIKTLSAAIEYSEMACRLGDKIACKDHEHFSHQAREEEDSDYRSRVADCKKREDANRGRGQNGDYEQCWAQ